MELPVEIRPKSSNAGRGPEAPIQPIGLATQAVCAQRAYSDALKLPFQKGACVSDWPVGGRFRDMRAGDLIILLGNFG